MDILQLARQINDVADLIVTDRAGQSLLFVQVKVQTQSRDQGIQIVREHIGRFGFPFGMLVDPEFITIEDRDRPDHSVQLPTFEVICSYDANFATTRKWIFPDYLQGMTESWLADFASSWRHHRPPHSEIMNKFGLLDRLRGCRIDVGGGIMT